MIFKAYTFVATWLAQPSLLGGHRYMWALLILLAGAEYVLGRSKNPRYRSVASALATALDKLLVAMRIAMIPVVGPIIISVLGSISGQPTLPAVAVVDPAPPAPPPDKQA